MCEVYDWTALYFYSFGTFGNFLNIHAKVAHAKITQSRSNDSNSMHHIPQLIAAQNAPLIGKSTLRERCNAPLNFGHSYITIMICLSGCAHFSLNFKEHVIKPMDILIFAEDSVVIPKHCSRAFKVFFCLMPKSFAENVAYPLPNALFLFLHQQPHCIPSPQEKKFLSMWITQLEDIIQSCATYQDKMLQNHIQNFFFKIAEQLPSEQNEHLKFSRKELLCWRFWELVCKHAIAQREVQFYANLLAVTPSYLSQLTRQFYNETPKGLIDRQVTQEIKALLSYSQMPIGHIADQLNFDDASYLCRYFKRQTGQALSAYRKKAFQAH